MLRNDGEIRRGRVKGNYTVIPNEIINASDLSLRAKGLLCWMLSKPDDWVFYKKNLHEGMLEGRDAVHKAWLELIKSGYVHSEPMRGDDGKMCGYYHTVFDYRVTGNQEHGESFRVTENPEDGVRVTGKPNTGNPQLLNTNREKTKEQLSFNSDELKGASHVDFVLVKEIAQTEAPGAAKPPDLPEDLQTPAPKKKAGKLSKNAKDAIYPKFIDIYHIWFKGHAGVAPKIDGAGGNAAKSMIAYLRGVSKVWDGTAWRMPETDDEFETAILNGWQYIFSNWHKLDSFYQNKTRLIDINSNFQNIISQIKNGHGKQSKVTNQTTAQDVATSFANIDEYFQSKDSETDNVSG